MYVIVQCTLESGRQTIIQNLIQSLWLKCKCLKFSYIITRNHLSKLSFHEGYVLLIVQHLLTSRCHKCNKFEFLFYRDNMLLSKTSINSSCCFQIGIIFHSNTIYTIAYAISLHTKPTNRLSINVCLQKCTQNAHPYDKKHASKMCAIKHLSTI